MSQKTVSWGAPFLAVFARSGGRRPPSPPVKASSRSTLGGSRWHPINQTMGSLHRILIVPLAGITIFLLTATSAPAPQLAKRLILKDGSYQLVTKYEVKGDQLHGGLGGNRQIRKGPRRR